MPGLESTLMWSALQANLSREGRTLDDIMRETASQDDVRESAFRGRFGDSTTVLGGSWTKLFSALAAITKAIQAKRSEFPGFGAPTTSVTPGDGDGYFQHFEHGSVFWTEGFGAHEVHGAIRDRYASMGWERSYLGYPTTDELTAIKPGVETRYSNFQHGSINWTASDGAFIPLSLSVWVEPHQLGAWVHISGRGFTPGGTVRFGVEGLTGFQGTKSIGVFAIVRADGTFADVVWDGRTWDRGGNAQLRATDQATGRSDTYSVPALY